MSLSRRLAAWAVSVLLLLVAWAAAGFWAAPRLLHSLATTLVRERMHRELSLGAIDVNPLRLTVTIHDLRLPGKNGAPLLAWRQARIEADLLRSLFQRAAVIKAARVEGLELDATIDATGQLNLADLALLAGPDTGDTGPPRFLVDALHVDGTALRFSQLDRRQPFSIRADRLQLKLTDFGTVGSHKDELYLALHTPADESIELRGRLRLRELLANARLDLRRIQAATLAGYLGDALPVVLDRGTLAAEAQLELDWGKTSPQLKAVVAKAELIDSALRAKGGKEDLIQLQRLTATHGQLDLGVRHASIGRLELEGAKARVIRDASGQLNLAALLSARMPTATAAHDASAPWQWQVPSIQLTGGEVALEDRGVKPAARATLRDIALKVTGLSQDASQPLDVDLGLRVDETGRFAARGRLQTDAARFQGKAEASSIDLRPLQPYVQQAADLSLLSAKLGFAFDVDASPQRTSLRGEADIRDLRTVDNALKQDLVQWKRLRARQIEYDNAPRQRLRIQELAFDAPYARVMVGQDRSLNLSHVLRADTGAATPASASTQAGMDIEIGLVRVGNGSANFADQWIQPHFAVGIQDLNGTIKGLSSDERSRATVDLKGAVDRYAPVVISGEINPLSAALYSDMSLSFRNLDLTSATPYSGRFAGYEIQKGKLSAELVYHISSRKLDARHHIVVDQFELGDPVESPDATSLPIRLAIALLKDRHGVIDIQLPVSGNLDDPQFRLAPLVWKMVVNLVVKAVTAPFALLGSLFGGGEELNQVTFIPGTAQLDDAGRQRLESLRKAMVERPSLRLDVPAAWSPDIDRPAMLRRQLEAQLADVAARSGSDRYAQLLAAWQEEAGNASLPPAVAAFEKEKRQRKDAQPPAETLAQLEEALLARLVVDDEELADLGRRRAQAIQDVLFETQDVDPVRVFVVDGKPAAADAQQLRIDLLLK